MTLGVMPVLRYRGLFRAHEVIDASYDFIEIAKWVQILWKPSSPHVATGRPVR
jgi:hypothetical protein